MAQIIRRKTREARVTTGVHPAIIRNAKLLYDVMTPFGIKDQVVLELQVEDEVLTRSYTQSLHEKSAFAPVVMAVLGKLPEVDEELDVEELIDQPCVLHIEHRTRENGDVWESVTRVSSANTYGKF